MDEQDGGNADSGTTGAQPLKTREQMAREDRDAFLASVDSELGEEQPAPPAKGKPAAKPEPTEEVETGDDAEDEDLEIDEDAEEDDDEDDDEDDVDLDDDEGDEEEGAAKVDADTSKRLDKVRKAERRAREAAAARDAKFEREKQEFIASVRPRMEKLERFESLESKVNSRPLDVLLSLGLKPENYGLAARALFAETDEGRKDPRNREAVAERASRLELEQRIADLQRRLDENDTKATTTAEQQRQEQQLDAYFARVKKTAGDAHPLAKHVLAKTPKKAERELTALTETIARKLGRLPKPGTVMKHYEAQVRRDLTKLGVDVDALAKAPAAPAKGAQPAKPNGAKPAPGKTNGARNGASNLKPWQQPSRDEVLAELMAGAADDSGLS